jgi:hypothetical protein
MVAEVKTLAMLADTALQAEDFLRAHELSEKMVDTVVSLRSSPSVKDSEVTEACEVCWVACFQLGRQLEFHDLDKKLSLLGRALELCPADKLYDILAAWRRLEKDDIEIREKRLSHGAGTGKSRLPQLTGPSSNMASSLRERLQEFHMPSPPLLSTPDAAALASRTFRNVAANFPFSVSHSNRPRTSEGSQPENQRQMEREDVSVQATRVFSKGIGWLIGADEEL